MIAFADDLILMTRGNTVLEAENIANVEMTKITTWANANKIQFNERKSKVLLLTKIKKQGTGNISQQAATHTGAQPQISRDYTE